jgi:hypothetical protein
MTCGIGGSQRLQRCRTHACIVVRRELLGHAITPFNSDGIYSAASRGMA